MLKKPFYSVVVAKTNLDLVETYGVHSFSYEESNDKDNQLTLQIRNQDIAMIDSDWLVQGTELYFIFGYKGQEQSAKKSAIITEIDINYVEEISVTIRVLDKGNLMKKVNRNRVWENLHASAIVIAIANIYKLDYEIIPTSKTYENLPQGNMSDFDFLRKLANENNRYLHVSNNVLYFTERKLDGKSSVTYTYRDGNSKVVSFKIKNKGIESLGVSSGAKVSRVNTETNETMQVETKPNETGTSALGKFLDIFDINSLFGSEKATNTVTHTTNDKDVLKNKLDKQVAESQLNAIEGTLTLEGEPNLKEGMIITIAGLAQKHNGNYFVTTVKHSISDSGYETVATVKKNATNKPITNNKELADKVNSTTGTTDVNSKAALKVVNYDVNGQIK